MPDDLTKLPHSINEPPDGMAVEEQPPLPSDSELSAMTRADLDALAESRGIDSSGMATKADVIAALKEAD